MKKRRTIKLNFLSDAPILKTDKEYYEFYHKYVSPALHNIIKTRSRIHTIGLFGTWGSGKSTIIDNLKEDYSDFPIFVFDAWKYQGDPLRRTFLINLFKFVDDNKLWSKNERLSDSFLDCLYENEAVSTSEGLKSEKYKGFWQSLWTQIKNVPKSNPLITLLSVIVAIGILLWLAGQYFLGEKHPVIAFFLKIPGIFSLSATAFLLIGIVVKKTVESMTDKLLKGLDIDLKTQTIIKSREFLNSPEQFETKFNEIVSRLNKKIVIVFDNIDRVQGDVAIEMLASIKTFFDPKEDRNVIFVIPCDSEAVVSQIKKYYGKNDTSFEPSEYLRKLFNVVIWTPEFISTDLEDFTRKCIKQLGTDYSLLNNEDVILVVTQAFRSNPREIKQFLNNLVASILIVGETEVWDIVKDNIAYLAKTLALKQKYPEAYKRLKIRWYEPEDITVGEGNSLDKNLQDFMLSTSSITVANAEPFIYYKLPNMTKEVKSSEELATALVGGNREKTKKLISDNKRKMSEVFNFVKSLLQKYGYEQNLLTNIISTFLPSVIELSIQLDNETDFLNHTAETIDKKIWANYQKLPTEDIFDKIIKNGKVKKVLRDKLITRYITALGSTELRQKDKIEDAINVINNFKSVKLDENQTLELQKCIQNGYPTNTSVMIVFETSEEQGKFVSKQALEAYIKSINYDNYSIYLPILPRYKKHIKNLELELEVVVCLTNLLSQERATQPQDNPNKRTMFSLIKELVDDPDSVLEGLEQQDIISFVSEIINAYQSAGDVNSRFYIVPLMHQLRRVSDENQQGQISSLVSEFIKISTRESLDLSLNNFVDESKAASFVMEYIQSFKQRAVSNNPDEIMRAYDFVDKPHKQEIINTLIGQKPDLGLPFIQLLAQVPDETETIIKMLDRLFQMPPQSRNVYYDWMLSSKLSKRPLSVKTAFAMHIKSLLESDDPISQAIGNMILQKQDFLNKDIKQVIAKELLEWLKTPGKILNNNYEQALGSLAFLFVILQKDVREQFLDIIFGLLNHEQERPILEMALRILFQINPNWKEDKSLFIDFGEKLKGWTNIDNRHYVVDELLKFRSQKQTKTEKVYWEGLETNRG